MYEIILVVQGEGNLCGMLKVLNRSVGGDEMVPDEDHRFQKGTELHYPVGDRTLDVFRGPEA